MTRNAAEEELDDPFAEIIEEANDGESEEESSEEEEESAEEEEEEGAEEEEADEDAGADDASGDEGSGGESDGEKASGDDGEDSEDESAFRMPRGAIKDIQKLRAQNRELRAQLERQQAPGAAPMPGQGQPPAPAPQPQTPAQLKVHVDENGQQYIDSDDLAAFQQAQAPQASQPPPPGATFASMRQEFVAQDPANNAPAAARVEAAADALDLLTARTIQELGYMTSSPQEWEQAMEASGALDEFRGNYPEFEGYDLKEFAYTVARSRMGDHMPIRFFMDNYMETGWRAIVGGGGSESQGEGSPAAEENSAPKRLAKQKPRSMAKKGASESPKTTLESELKELEDAIDNDPFGTDLNLQETTERITKIRNKLGLPT